MNWAWSRKKKPAIETRFSASASAQTTAFLKIGRITTSAVATATSERTTKAIDSTRYLPTTSKATSSAATITLASASGNSRFQPSDISWS